MDVILSSGYLAMARHVGVLEALENQGVRVSAVTGTSSGALVGALYAAGAPLSEISRFLLTVPPFRYLSLHSAPWRGLFHAGPLLRALSAILPPTFADLPRPLAVGVVGRTCGHRLLSQGPLPEAVVASLSVPGLLCPVQIADESFLDGGAYDRVAVDGWRRIRPGQKAVVHVVERTRGIERLFRADGLVIVRTPRARASLRSLRDFHAQRQEARERALPILRASRSEPIR